MAWPGGLSCACSLPALAACAGGARRARPAPSRLPGPRRQPVRGDPGRARRRSTSAGCATPTAGRSTARPATCTSPTWAATSARRSTYLPRAEIAGANLGWHCFEGNADPEGLQAAQLLPARLRVPEQPRRRDRRLRRPRPRPALLRGALPLRPATARGVWVARPRGPASPSMNVSAAIAGVTSFGEDGAGHLYATSYDGPLYRLGESAGALTLTQIGDVHPPGPGARRPPATRASCSSSRSAGRVKLLDGRRGHRLPRHQGHASRTTATRRGCSASSPRPTTPPAAGCSPSTADNGGDIQVDEYRRTATGPGPVRPEHAQADR